MTTKHVKHAHGHVAEPVHCTTAKAALLGLVGTLALGFLLVQPLMRWEAVGREDRRHDVDACYVQWCELLGRHYTISQPTDFQWHSLSRYFIAMCLADRGYTIHLPDGDARHDSRTLSLMYSTQQWRSLVAAFHDSHPNTASDRPDFDPADACLGLSGMTADGHMDWDGAVVDGVLQLYKLFEDLSIKTVS